MKKWLAISAMLALSAALSGFYATDAASNASVVPAASGQIADINTDTKTAMAGRTPQQYSAARPTDERLAGRQDRQLAEVRATLQQMQAGISQQNLQQWLQQLWAECEKAAPAQCRQQLAQYQQQLSAAQAAWLQQLLAQYQDYQQLLGELVMDTSLDKPTQYNEVRKLRRRLFADDYDSLFGREEQWAEHRFAYGQLLAQREQLDAAQRLDALFAQQQKLSSQLQPLLSADLLYQQALDMLAGLPDSERQLWLPQLRQRYFGADAEQVAQHEAHKAAQQQQRQLYLKQRAQLQQHYSSLKQQLLASNANTKQLQQWQQSYAAALAQLRQQYFSQ